MYKKRDMKKSLILKRAIFLSAFLTLLLCFEQVFIADCRAYDDPVITHDRYTITLDKGDSIQVQWSQYNSGPKHTVHMLINGVDKAPFYDEPVPGGSPYYVTCIWSGTIEDSNTTVEIYEDSAISSWQFVPEPYDQNWVLTFGKPWPEPDAIGHITLFPGPPPVKIKVYNDNRENIIFPINSAMNYPETHFVTFVALQRDPNTKKMGRYKGTEPIEIKMDMKAWNGNVNYYLAPLGGVCGNAGVDDINFVNWKGFYYAGGGPGGLSRYEGALDGTKPGTSSVQFYIDKDLNPATVAVMMWSVNRSMLNFNAEIVSKPPDTEVELEKQHNSISTNMDNVDFYRANRPSMVPPAGTNYTAYPGPFLVKGTDRPYSDIVGILADAERRDAGEAGGPWPTGGNGPDWLQVAAMVAYSASNAVSNCVWEISATCGDNAGQVNWGTPYKVELNPFQESMRFNQVGRDIYGFTSCKWRDGTIWHEALHCYHMLPGPNVNDEETNARYNDTLYAGSGLLCFSSDDRSRGFLRPNVTKKSAVEKWLDGHSGDNQKHSSKTGTFIQGLGISTDEMIKMIDEDLIVRRLLDMPGNLPFDCGIEPLGVYLYNPSKHMERDVSPIFGFLSESYTVYGSNGAYTAYSHSINISGTDYGCDSSKFREYVKQGYTQLYLLYSFDYKDEPYEYDASYFAMKGG